MKYSLLTTFHKAGYDRYARNSIWLMDQALPEECVFSAYYQDVTPDIMEQTMNIKWFDYNESVNGYKEYKEKYKDLPAPKEKKGFVYDHIRFCHKVYSVLAHFENRKDDARYIVWVDADIIPVKKLTLDFLDSTTKEPYFMSLLRRSNNYAECGFIVWDTHRDETKEYLKRMRHIYDSGEMFEKYKDIGWHDSVIWEGELDDMIKEGLGTDYNLSTKSKKTPNAKVTNHPLVQGFLGEYLDHLKGRRKDSGYSPERISVWGNQ